MSRVSEIADLGRQVSNIPSDLPDGASWPINLPAGHWRKLDAPVSDHARNYEILHDALAAALSGAPGWQDQAKTALEAQPSGPAEAPTALHSSIDDIRKVFEQWTRDHQATWRIGTLIVNGRFSHYTDPDTDTAWLGFYAAARLLPLTNAEPTS